MLTEFRFNIGDWRCPSPSQGGTTLTQQLDRLAGEYALCLTGVGDGSWSPLTSRLTTAGTPKCVERGLGCALPTRGPFVRYALRVHATLQGDLADGWSPYLIHVSDICAVDACAEVCPADTLVAGTASAVDTTNRTHSNVGSCGGGTAPDSTFEFTPPTDATYDRGARWPPGGAIRTESR